VPGGRSQAQSPATERASGAVGAALDREREEFGPDYRDLGLLFCWENGLPPHPDTITRRFKKISRDAGLPTSTSMTCAAAT
jgi:hypothetical protein